MNNAVVVINAGSSSLKFSVHAAGDDGQVDLCAKGRVEGIGNSPHFIVKDPQGNTLAERRWPHGETVLHEQFFGCLFEWIEGYLDGAKPEVVGHRVVHGGTRFTAPVQINDDVLGALEALNPLAPLHQPHNLAAIRVVAEIDPDVPQVACFDTAFHHGHAAVADRFALPGELYDLGVRRYGFHGLSYEFIARSLTEVAPEIAEGRVVVAHLGSGASMCAIDKGRSIDSTMGFTALDGLPMGTRCGALDPGVILYLIRERGMTTEAIEDLLYHQSGMLGVSGISSDMRDLLENAAPKAQLAVDLFVFRIVRELGALAAVMGGIDGLVFTAGIGENAPEIRARVCDAARWLGIDLDPGANQAGGPRITTSESAISAWVIPTNEERMVALHALATVRG